MKRKDDIFDRHPPRYQLEKLKNGNMHYRIRKDTYFTDPEANIDFDSPSSSVYVPKEDEDLVIMLNDSPRTIRHKNLENLYNYYAQNQKLKWEG